MKIGILGAAAVSVIILSGCGSSDESATSPPEETQTSEETPAPEETLEETPPPADGGSYSSLEELQQAYIDAGGDCASLDHANNVTLAAESGNCNEDTVISTYLSPEMAQEVIQNNKALNEELGYESDSMWLVGQNWIINSPDAAETQEEMGGQLVSF